MQPEPTKNDLSPMTRAETEPVLLLDTTGSMSWPASDSSPVTRQQVVHEALSGVVAALEAKDSQAAAESAAAGEQEGGVMLVTFSDGTAQVLEDINSANFVEKWGEIVWGGSTLIMPGWNEVLENYMEEFGDQPITERPALLALVITDGEASDMDEFAKVIAGAKAGTYIAVAVIGHGSDHDKALAQWQQAAEGHDHVRILTFGGETDPKVISDGLLAMVG
jgi:hypothetical protein